ncbi:protein bric-a-brac 1-like isoform X5 [Cloeon dipterum]|uniref:protein bric-a-brac 1-like isoform X5 n=1 Tax=Cloeon dipterum TaxID=197152 RepID=UPI00321FD43F
MSTAQQFCLRWNNHQPNFVTVFSSLLHSQALTDVTLAADGQQIEAHKLVLSACSTYFQALFTSYSGHQHPIVILKDVTFRDLRTMVDFMYSGEVHVTQEQLPSIIKTAEMLKVKGLAEGQDMSHVDKSQDTQLSTESSRLSCEALGASTESHQTWSSERRSPSPSISPSAASRRKRMRKSSTGSTSGSGVAERVSDHQSEVAYPHHSPRLEQQGSAQMNLSTDMSERSIREQASTDSEIQNCSQDSGNEQMPLSMVVHPGVQQQQQQHPSRAVEEVPSPLMEPSAAHHYSPLSASAGFQWDPSHSSVYYPRYPHPSCSFINTGPPTISPDALRHNVVPAFQPKRQSPCSINIPSVSQASPAPSTPSPSAPPAATPPTSPSPTVRRKRTDTQRDENFLQALEAVRTGGIGFCKAARMYGVNNRTLWLEYRRRGYPITRPSLKPRATTPQEYQYPTVVMKKEPGDSSCSNDDSTLGEGTSSMPPTPEQQQQQQQQPPPQQQQQPPPPQPQQQQQQQAVSQNQVAYQQATPAEVMFLQSSDIF